MYRKVLSLVMGKPTLPPNCCRLSESLMGAPVESGASGLKACPGSSAGPMEKGLRASMASSRKKANRVPCTLLVPDLVTMLMAAPLAPPRSAL